MRLTSELFIEKVVEVPVIPVFNHSDKELAVEVVRACYSGGIRLFEFTDRSKDAINVFRFLLDNQSEYPEMSLGIGSILDVDQCKKYYDVGASFIVAPIVDKSVAEFCMRQNISWTPGCGTLTEIVMAERLGARLIKVFPADVLGPKFVKGVLGPCAHLKLMPTGGVSPDKENLKSWFDAGVTCVGMGSQLISKEVINNKDFNGLKASVRNCIQLIKDIRKK